MWYALFELHRNSCLKVRFNARSFKLIGPGCALITAQVAAALRRKLRHAKLQYVEINTSRCTRYANNPGVRIFRFPHFNLLSAYLQHDGVLKFSVQ